MGRSITATIPHKLGKDEARRRIAEGFGSIRQQTAAGFGALLAVRERWEGDCLHFEAGGLGQRMSGRLDVLPDSIEIEHPNEDAYACVVSLFPAPAARGH